MNILFPVPAGQNGYKPNVRSLDAHNEDLSAIIAPGFLNAILNMGNTINPDDMLLVSYKNGTQFFTQSLADGVVTLMPANDTIAFPFTKVQFVAKGGSDLNTGNTLESPKLTISAALSAVGTNGLVWVLDYGTYEENLVPPMGVSLYAPNAILTASSGVIITIPDTGISYGVNVNCASLQAPGTVVPYVINGALSNLYLTSIAIVGGTAPSVVSGRLYLTAIQYVSNNISVSASGHIVSDVDQPSSATITIATGGTVDGKFGELLYGNQIFKNKITFQQDELQETVGRQLAADDGVSTIQFNSVTDSPYTLPQTSAVAIPIGAVVTFIQLGLGRVNFTAGAGVTIINSIGGDVSTSGTATKAFAEKLSDTVWIVSGEIQPTTGP